MANFNYNYFKKEVRREEEKVDIDANTGSFGTFRKGRDTCLAPLVRGKVCIDLFWSDLFQRS